MPPRRNVRRTAGRARRQIAACVGLAAVLALMAAGCGRREAPADRAARDGVLLRSIGPSEPVLDPHRAGTLADGAVLTALLEGLVAPDPQTLEPRPAVAGRWDISADGTVYTFHLRPEARWSNGDPVTAEDFVASIRRALTPALGARNAYFMHVLRGARTFNTGATDDFATVGAAALDAHTLRLTLEAPTPHFLALLTHFSWLPLHLPTVRAAGPEASPGNPWARPEGYVGNGPFMPAEHVPDQFLRLAPNPHYRAAGSLQLKGVVFHVFAVATEELAFRTGQIHVTDALPIAKVPAYRRERPEVLRVSPAFGTYFYRINVTRPPLDDVRVRRALSAAVNRELLTSTLLNAVYAPARALTPPGTAGYTPPALAVDDLAAARQWLADSGHPGGAGLRQLGILFNTSENHRLIAEVIQEMWRTDLGVAPMLANQELGVFRQNCAQLNYDIARASWFGDYADPLSFLEIFTSGNQNNQTGWSDAGYDRRVAEAARTMDAARRLQLFAEAETILLSEAPIIPIYVYSTVRLVDPRVRGWIENPLDQHPWTALSLEVPSP